MAKSGRDLHPWDQKLATLTTFYGLVTMFKPGLTRVGLNPIKWVKLG